MKPTIWIVAGALLFLGGIAAAVVRVEIAVRKAPTIETAMGEATAVAIPLGDVLLPISAALIGMLVSLLAAARARKGPTDERT